MTNYEIIKRYLEFGFKVKCQLYNNEWVIFTSLCVDGAIRRSNWRNELGKCYETLGNTFDYEKDLNGFKFLSITPIIEKPKMYEVGDLVDIAKEAGVKFLKNYLSGWQITEIEDEESGLNYEVNKDTERLWISHYYLTPHIPEQDDEVAKAMDKKEIMEEIRTIAMYVDSCSKFALEGNERYFSKIKELLDGLK